MRLKVTMHEHNTIECDLWLCHNEKYKAAIKLKSLLDQIMNLQVAYVNIDNIFHALLFNIDI